MSWSGLVGGFYRSSVASGIIALASAVGACSASSAKQTDPGGGSGAMGGSGGSTGGTTGGTAPAGAGGAGATGGGLDLTGGSAGAGGTPEGCASDSIESDLLPANILFVVDRSGSMNCNLPPLQAPADCEAMPQPVDTTAPTRWGTITAALKEAFAALPSNSRAGLTYFSNDNICGVQSMPNVGVNPVDATQVSSLSLSLDSVTPKGGTPIVGATILAYKHLHEQAKLPGNNFVVLITDGADTCDPDKIPRLLDIEMPKATGPDVNIRTFVIGAPGSEPARSLLSQMAWQGGTARDPACDHMLTDPTVGDCHFDMTTSTDFAADLADALAAISGAALTCEFDVPESTTGESVDPNLVNVDYFANGTDRTPVLQDTSADCDAGAEGWQYNDDQTKIILCGSICDQVKGDGAARVEIILGCKTVVK